MDELGCNVEGVVTVALAAMLVVSSEYISSSCIEVNSLEYPVENSKRQYCFNGPPDAGGGL
jgi:hypothetical protein